MRFIMFVFSFIFLGDGGKSLDHRVQPSSIIETSVGAVLLIAALLAWFFDRGEL